MQFYFSYFIYIYYYFYNIIIIIACNYNCGTCEDTNSNCLTCKGNNRDNSDLPNCPCLYGYTDFNTDENC